MARKLRGGERGAAIATVGLVLCLIVPATLLVLSLVTSGIDLARRLLESDSARSALDSIVADGSAAASLSQLEPQRIVDLVREHGTGAWRTVRAVLGATVSAVIGMFVFVVAVYTFLLRGKRAYQSLLDHSPLPVAHTARFASAFAETGRGLFFGVGLTALLQGIVATIGFIALGLPKAGVLGGLTILAAFVPSLGAAFVWVPVAASLAMVDRPIHALIMLAIGIFLSTADNFVRPALSRYGRLELPMFVVLVAMLGGLIVFGAWGVLLGPLIVRLTVEGLRILRARSLIHARSPAKAQACLSQTPERSCGGPH